LRVLYLEYLHGKYAKKVDNELHTIMNCMLVDTEWDHLVQVIGPFDLGGLVTPVLENSANWRAVTRLEGEVMTAKRKAERNKQHQ
jgi:hypothetical protein